MEANIKYILRIVSSHKTALATLRKNELLTVAKGFIRFRLNKYHSAEISAIH